MGLVLTVKKKQNFSGSTVVGIVVFILLFGIAVGVLSTILNRVFNPADSQAVRDILNYPTLAFTIYFVYTFVASIIVPIPTLPLDLIMLTVADPWPVIWVRLLGGLAGGSVSFYLSRQYGLPLLKKWFSPKNYNFVEEASNNLTWQEFFIITMLPVINAELMAYVGGVSKVKFRWILAILTLAIFYRLVFVFFVIKV